MGATRTLFQSYKVFLGAPFLTQRTSIISHQSDYSTSNGTLPIVQMNYGNVNNDLSYNGFEIFPASGTITGSVSVFAYAK